MVRLRCLLLNETGLQESWRVHSKFHLMTEPTPTQAEIDDVPQYKHRLTVRINFTNYGADFINYENRQFIKVLAG
jgi:hypothetical protein